MTLRYRLLPAIIAVFLMSVFLVPGVQAQDTQDTPPRFSSAHKLQPIVTWISDTGPFRVPGKRGKEVKRTVGIYDTKTDTPGDESATSHLVFTDALSEYLERHNRYEITRQSIRESNDSLWSFFTEGTLLREEFIPGQTSTALRNPDEFEEFQGVFSGINMSYPILGQDGTFSLAAGSNYGNYQSNRFTTEEDEYFRPRIRGNLRYSIYPNAFYEKDSQQINNGQRKLRMLSTTSRQLSSHASNLLTRSLMHDLIQNLPHYKERSGELMDSIRQEYKKGLISEQNYYRGLQAYLSIKSTTNSILARWEKLTAQTPDTPVALPRIPLDLNLPDREPIFLRRTKLELAQTRHERDRESGQSLDFSGNYLQEWRDNNNGSQENWEVQLNYSVPITSGNTSEQRNVERLEQELQKAKKRAKKSRSYLPREYRQSVTQLMTAHYQTLNAWRQLKATEKRWEFGDAPATQYLSAINRALSADISLTRSYITTFKQYIRVKSQYRTKPDEIVLSLEKQLTQTSQNNE